MKNELRIQSIEKRKNIDTVLKSKLIIKKLFEINEYKISHNIICYYPLKYEISTLACLDDCSKHWFLPKVNGNNLDICPYYKDKLELGSYNIFEPQTKKLNSYDNIQMIIIPAIAADKKGYRIGYGKGYYDRFLKCLPPNVIKVILVYSDFLYETVFPNKYDVSSDIIITDKEIFRI